MTAANNRTPTIGARMTAQSTSELWVGVVVGAPVPVVVVEVWFDMTQLPFPFSLSVSFSFFAWTKKTNPRPFKTQKFQSFLYSSVYKKKKKSQTTTLLSNSGSFWLWLSSSRWWRRRRRRRLLTRRRRRRRWFSCPVCNTCSDSRGCSRRWCDRRGCNCWDGRSRCCRWSFYFSFSCFLSFFSTFKLHKVTRPLQLLLMMLVRV